MKRLLSLLSFVCLFVLGSYAANARIYAYGLKLTTEGDNYTFKFTANEVPTEAYLVFYSVGTGKEIGTYEIPNANTIAKGVEKTVTLTRNQLPGGGTMNWGVRLKAGAIESFGLVYADASLTYARAYANVDTHPESDYFGTIYVANRKPTKSESRLYIYDQTCKKSATAYLLGESEWAFGRFAIAENGKLYLSDYSDNHSGCFIVDPSDLTHSTQFFAGTRAGSGLFTYNSTIETGSSLAATHIYGKGENAKLFAVAEDYTGYTGKFPVAIYNIGNTDGTLKESWTTAPNTIYQTLGNAAQNFDIRGCDKGAWVATSRGAGQNNASATSLRFYDFEGNCKYSSSDHTDIINGSLGGGFTITDDGKTMYLVNGNGNILELSISWSGNTPSLSLQKTHTTTYSAISSINIDYAGNLVVTAGSSFNTTSTAQLGLSVYTMPTSDNTCTVPAKKSLTVYAPLSGTFNVGGDEAIFTSLASAMDTLEHYGIKGDCNFRICADLAETKNIGIANNTTHTIRIIPNSAVKRTISFGSTPDNSGPSGHVIVGTKNNPGWSDTIATRNVVIDGSFDGEGQYLEFRNGTIGGRVIVLYGDVSNTTIKNCRIINTRTSGSNHAIHFRSGKLTDGPHNNLVENCYLQVDDKNSTTTYVINFDGANATNSSGYPTNNIIQNCEIVGYRHCAYLKNVNGVTFENNTFRIPQATGGYLIQCIYGVSGLSGTINIRGNKFTELKSKNTTGGDCGLQAITASGGGTWIIENNYFGGLDLTESGAAGKSMRLGYIRCGNYCEIRHNTFHMPALTYKPSSPLAATNQSTFCVWIAANTPIIENNIFVSDETTAYNSLISGNLNSNVRNNVFYHGGGNAAVVVVNSTGTTKHTTFEDLPASYQSTNKWQQVEFETGSYIPTAAYLNNFNLGVERIEGFNKDIEGNIRNYPTRAGCYDPAWEITLDQAADNDATLAQFNLTMVDATIKRQFIADGGWYTITLPFDVSAQQVKDIFGEGTEIAVLQQSRWKTASDLYLSFAKQSHIEATVPSLIKPAESTGTDLLFRNVVINNMDSVIDTEVAQMIGSYSPISLEYESYYANNSYYLGSGDLLYDFAPGNSLNGFRAFFHLDLEPGSPAPTRLRVVFNEDTVTELEELPETTEQPATVQKVIRDGQLLIIRDGKEYNVQGQLVR